MASYRLENDRAFVEVDEYASEIHSFKDKESGIEAMWQGDPKFWAGRNPTLFPMVGKTWDQILHINGREYRTGNHGFARHEMFRCVEHDEKHIVMELRENAETLEQYPFAFQLRIMYTLEGKTLHIRYAVKNMDAEVMPFHFGLHPAFNCPLEEGESFASYHLKLNKKEQVGGIFTDTIDLDRDALAHTIIIDGPKSTETILTNGKHGVAVHYEGYPWVAYWSPDGAPFVCIEPWYSHTDFKKEAVAFREREGTIELQQQEVWNTEYSIRLI